MWGYFPVRLLNRNKQTFWFATYSARTEILVDGKRTGEHTAGYSNPVEAKGNISAARGDTSTNLFGENVRYDRTIALENRGNIDEHTILWVDEDPEIAVSGAATVPHDYIVKRVATSLNGNTLLAISRVDVSD